MAILTPGPLASEVSGRIGGTIFAHNRGGMYVRNGTKPIKVTTPSAMTFKAILGTASKLWTMLTSAEIAAWNTFATNNPQKNRLGRQISLTGQNFFIRLNSRLMYANADIITLPPTAAPPNLAAISAMSVTAATGTVQITFDDSGLGANDVLWIKAAASFSPTKNNVNNLFTSLPVSVAQPTSPLNVGADVVAKLGTLQKDQFIYLEIRTLDTKTGLVSTAQYARAKAA